MSNIIGEQNHSVLLLTPLLTLTHSSTCINQEMKEIFSSHMERSGSGMQCGITSRKEDERLTCHP